MKIILHCDLEGKKTLLVQQFFIKNGLNEDEDLDEDSSHGNNGISKCLSIQEMCVLLVAKLKITNR